MNTANQILIENLQKLSLISGDYEVQVFGPSIKGRILLRNGRIKSAESGNTKDEAALIALILCISTKHTVRKLSEDGVMECRIDLSPGEAIIMALQSASRPHDVSFNNEETQPINGLRPQTDVMRMYQVVLVEIHPSHHQQEHLLLPGRNLLGRVGNCRVKVYSREASRVHAIISVNEDSVEIADAQTLNGTKVNGKFVTEAELHDGDQLDIGEISYRVSLRLKLRNSEDRKKLLQQTVRSSSIHFKRHDSCQTRMERAGKLISGLFQEEEKAQLGVVECR